MHFCTWSKMYHKSISKLFPLNSWRWLVSVSSEKQLFIYHHRAVLVRCRKMVPKLSLLMEATWPHCRNPLAKNSALQKWGLWCTVMVLFLFLWNISKRMRHTLKCQQGGIYFTSSMRPVLCGVGRLMMLMVGPLRSKTLFFSAQCGKYEWY